MMPAWACPDCGTEYSCVGGMSFCPRCREAEELKLKLWEEKRAAEWKAQANDIVERILHPLWYEKSQ